MIAMANGLSRLVYQKAFILDEMATNTNQAIFQLPIISKGVILTMIDAMPSPDASIYIALGHTASSFGTWGSWSSAILRPNGTIGTDTSICSYNASTGQYKIGGTYGFFPAGVQYHIYAFEIEG